MFDILDEFEHGQLTLIDGPIDEDKTTQEQEKIKRINELEKTLYDETIRKLKRMHDNCYDHDISSISRFSNGLLCRVDYRSGIYHVSHAKPLVFKSGDETYDLLEPSSRWVKLFKINDDDL